MGKNYEQDRNHEQGHMSEQRRNYGDRQNYEPQIANGYEQGGNRSAQNNGNYGQDSDNRKYDNV